MIHQPFSEGDSMIHRLDPRGRIVAAMALAIVLAVARQWPTLLVGLTGALALIALAQLRVRSLMRMLAGLNVFMAGLWVGLLLAEGRAGIAPAGMMTLKANAILLLVTALIGTQDLAVFTHALHHLRLPGKLVVLLMLSVRYGHVLRQELHRLHDAMRVRGFRPRLDTHTSRSYAHLAGMMLVRSVDRSERIGAAMRCRGFTGTFPVLRHFHAARRDTVFAIVMLLTAAVLIVLETPWLMR